MSASVTSIEPPRVDPLREALREAIEAERAAKLAAAERESAISRARGMVADAEAALAKAREGVAAAREEEATRLAEGLARGGTPSASTAVRRARALEAEAVDEVESLRDAAGRIAATLPDLEEDVARARSDTMAAANAVVAAAASHALDEVRTARRGYVRSLAALQAILAAEDERLAPRFANPVEYLRRSEQRAAPFLPIRDEAGAFVRGGQAWIVEEEDHLVAERVTAGWRRARAALIENPDAPLPTSSPEDDAA